VLFTNTSPAYLELRQKDGGSDSSSSAGLWIAVGVAAVLIIGGGLWFRSRRKETADERE